MEYLTIPTDFDANDDMLNAANTVFMSSAKLKDIKTKIAKIRKQTFEKYGLKCDERILTMKGDVTAQLPLEDPRRNAIISELREAQKKAKVLGPCGICPIEGFEGVVEAAQQNLIELMRPVGGEPAIYPSPEAYIEAILERLLPYLKKRQAELKQET